MATTHTTRITTLNTEALRSRLEQPIEDYDRTCVHVTESGAIRIRCPRDVMHSDTFFCSDHH